MMVDTETEITNKVSVILVFLYKIYSHDIQLGFLHLNLS